MRNRPCRTTRSRLMQRVEYILRAGAGGAAQPPAPEPDLIGLYLMELVAHADGSSPFVWVFVNRGMTLDRSERRIATVLDDSTPLHLFQKEAILALDIVATAATLLFDLRGLRDPVSQLCRWAVMNQRAWGWMPTKTTRRIATGGLKSPRVLLLTLDAKTG